MRKNVIEISGNPRKKNTSSALASIGEKSYFLVDKDFVTVALDDTGVPYYEVEIYASLLPALIEGFDEIKCKITTQPTDNKFNFFYGQTPAHVEYSILNFVSRAKKSMEHSSPNSDDVTEEVVYDIISLLSDDVVSGVGNGSINKDNYQNHLNLVEQDTVSPSALNTTVAEDKNYVDGFDEATKKIFQESIIHPAEISLLPFPGEVSKRDSDGVSEKTSLIPYAVRSSENLFNYYREFYVTNNNTNLLKTTTTSRAENQRIILKLPLVKDLTPTSAIDNLSVVVTLMRQGVEATKQIYQFENSFLWRQLSIGGKKVSLEIFQAEDRYALPDYVSISNNETYAVNYRLYEITMSSGQFNNALLNEGKIDARTSIELPARKVYFDGSEPRVYAVETCLNLGGAVEGLYNLAAFARPPQARPIKPGPDEVILLADPAGSDTKVKLTLFGLVNENYTATITRKTIGKSEDKLIASLTKKINAVVDQSIVEGEIYLYTADIMHNGAKSFLQATTGYLSLDNGTVRRLQFEVVDKDQRKKSDGKLFHTFRINETITSTTATDLLQSVSDSAQAELFQEEIESSKQDTGIVTKYLITRENCQTGNIVDLGLFDAGVRLSFPALPSVSKYRYYIFPKATSTSAISYETSVEEVDLSTGNSYKYSYKKYRDENFPRSQVLPSRTEVSDNNIDTVFRDLPPGAPEQVTFTTRFSQGEVKRLTARHNKLTGGVVLTWSYVGSLNEVLHFVVFADYGNFVAPIGATIPTQEDKRQLYFCDTRLSQTEGLRYYSVLPIMKDGKKGRISQKIYILPDSNYPQGALRSGKTQQ